MHITTIRQKALLMGDMQHRTVIHLRVLRQPATKLFWVPCIEMRIEVQHGDFTPCMMESPEGGES